MEFRVLGKAGVRVSTVALGGHEFHADGSVKGFMNGRDATGRADFVDPGFATPQRRELVAAAMGAGINYFDVTIDPEVAAIGKTLPPAAARPDLLVQCRPQGMCYKYEQGNKGLGDFGRLKAEVERLIKLSGRPRLDVLNFGIEAPSMESDEGFLGRVSENIAALKAASLIRFASCDTIDSGEQYYEKMMRAGCFEVVWLHFSPLWPFPAEKILPLARELGMGVVVREAFSKGALFKIADQAGLNVPRGLLAAAAIRWILASKEVSTLVLGMRNAAELDANLAAAGAAITPADIDLLRRLQSQPAFQAALEENRHRFHP